MWTAVTGVALSPTTTAVYISPTTTAVYVALVLLTGGVGIAVSVLAWRYRGQPGSKPLAAFALASGLLAIAHALTLARGDLVEMEVWARLALSVSAVLPVAWLLFALEYTGWNRRQWLPILLAEPLVFTALVWTNPLNVIWSETSRTEFSEFDALAVEFGLGFWAHQVFVAACFVLGGALLARLLVRRNRQDRRQATALLGMGALVLGTNTLFSFGIFPAGLDPTGIVGVFAGVVIAVIVLETELRAIAPVTRELGRETLLDELDDAILILDEHDRVIELNPAGEQLFDVSVDQARGESLSTVLPGLSTALDQETTTVELEHGGSRRQYDVRISQLSRGYGTLSGTVVSLRDVTEQRQQRQRLEVLNRLLRHNVRNELNVVRGKIELAQAQVDDETAHQYLDGAATAVDTIVDRSNKVGRVSRLLDSEDSDTIDIGRELIEHHRAGGFDHDDGSVDIDLSEGLVVAGGTTLVGAFEELVSNALVHNDSEEPHVRITVDDDRSTSDHVVIAVEDNGPGIDEQEWKTIVEGRETPLQHTSGVGLWLIHWVVSRAGGSVEFAQQNGSVVRVRLSRREVDERK